jgi:flagellin
MKIATNSAAMTAQRNLTKSSALFEQKVGGLSSGFRLNRAADDAAGMGIANKLRADGRALSQAARNASQANSLVQIADGAVTTISSILDRMKELATQSSSDNVTDSDRTKLQAEFVALRSEIDRITESTKYQGQQLLKGTYGVSVDLASSTIDGAAGSGISATGSGITLSGAAASTTYTITDAAGTGISASATVAGSGVVTQALTQSAAAGAQTLNFDKLGIQLSLDTGYVDTGLNTRTIVTSAAAGGRFIVGAGATVGEDNIDLALSNVSSTGLAINASSLASSTNAQTAVGALNTAIDTVNSLIGTIGAAQNRLDYAGRNLASLIENLAASESVLRDADIGAEMIDFTKSQILQQAGTAMLAQANAGPQTVLQLLRG